MSHQISIEDAAAVIQQAFLPLECAAEVQDDGQKLGLIIYDLGGKPVLAIEPLARSQVTDRRSLESYLFQMREKIEGKGHVLSPWSLPD